MDFRREITVLTS